MRNGTKRTIGVVLHVEADRKDGSTYKVVLEGSNISSRCRSAVEWEDGIVMAICYVKRDGQYVLNARRTHALTETVMGRGHIFPTNGAGCCQRVTT